MSAENAIRWLLKLLALGLVVFIGARVIERIEAGRFV